jgi:outer membrane receptor protein involved in Fe transport
MSFLLTSAREEEDLQSVVVAQTAQGAIRENVPAPAINTYVSARLTWQPNDRQSMFFQENFQDRWQNNVGVGGTALAEAGTQNRFREDEFIFNHRFVFTPKLLSQFRILVGRYWAPTRSNREAVRVVVSDAFTGGGAQADRLSTEFHAAITWMLTQTAGRHTLKYGINVPDWSRRGLSDRSNQLGSFSYASLADYASGNPFAAVVQRGDPRTVFVEKNVGGFLQDEWQIRRNLQLSMGARYDWQNYFGDTNNFAPRLAIAWSPERANKLVLRVGAGTFFDRSGPGPVWDILRFNGVQLRRYVLGGPDLSAFLATGAILAPTSVHRLASNVALPNVAQFSASAEYQLAKKTTLALGYVGFRGVEQFRSRDANAPLPPQFGARPERSVNALREIESAGRVQGDSFEVTLRGALGPKATGTAQYVFARTLTNTGGVNWYPANSFDPRGEWGRADTDRRHQFNLLGTAALHRWVNLGFSISLLTGVPYNITTGRDDNGDGMAIDRPVGVTRNTGLGPGYATVDLRWFREFRFRPALKDKSPSMTVSLDALNLLNKINPVNYVGALSSPFFGQAVATQPARRVQIGARLQF